MPGTTAPLAVCVVSYDWLCTSLFCRLDIWIFKADIAGCFNQLHLAKSRSTYGLCDLSRYPHYNAYLWFRHRGYSDGVEFTWWCHEYNSQCGWPMSGSIYLLGWFLGSGILGAGSLKDASEAQTVIRAVMGFEGLSVKRMSLHKQHNRSLVS